jgi:hypothetical protein
VRQAAPAPVRPRRQWGWLGLAAAGALAVAGGLFFLFWTHRTAPQPAESEASLPPGSIRLTSSDHTLEARFEQARSGALRCVYKGDAVGSWYAANWYDRTTEDRYAFYMRDVAHQSTGAAALGLTAETRNMLHRFAAAVSSKRRYCGFWGINKDGFPAPIDYRSDSDFYYCLPANFDVMRACYQQYLWTGDESYFDSVFSSFYDRSVADYVAAWDRDGDGLIESHLEPGARGRGSYYQFAPKALVGADMVAVQYWGYLTYARVQERKGARGSLSQRVADQYRAKADELRIRYNTAWWDAAHSQYYSMLLPDKSYYSGYIPDSSLFALMSGLTEPGARTESTLDSLIANRSSYEPTQSYFPEVLFQYGRNDAAYRFLMEISSPDFAPHTMPEMVFATVGAVVTGLMGVAPAAPAGTLETLPHLPQGLDWVRLEHVPVLANQLAVLHRGRSETALTNQAGPALQWKASFPAAGDVSLPKILIDGSAVPAAVERRRGQNIVTVTVPVKPGQTRTAKYPAI